MRPRKIPSLFSARAQGIYKRVVFLVEIYRSNGVIDFWRIFSRKSAGPSDTQTQKRKISNQERRMVEREFFPFRFSESFYLLPGLIPRSSRRHSSMLKVKSLSIGALENVELSTEG